MRITSAEFVTSAFEKRGWVSDARPEISFLGRSNVGKSSLINSLLGRRSLARTSNTPGRTQSINFFLINDDFYFVDLPGYGYAKVSKSMRSDWGKLAEEYLSEREQLRMSIHLVDARHPPTKLDMQLNEWLLFNKKAHLTVITKADKLSKNELHRSTAATRKIMGGSHVIAYSAVTGLGKDELWSEIARSIEI
jgi:GTP-binding protein